MWHSVESLPTFTCLERLQSNLICKAKHLSYINLILSESSQFFVRTVPFDFLRELSWSNRPMEELVFARNVPYPIETANEEKDLGVTFQQDLKFSGHIAEKVNKANSVLSLIVRTFDYIEKESFILLYKALIRPVVEYGNSIWHPFLRKDFESVEKVQKRATKLVPELKHLTLIERLKRLKLPSLAHRRRRDDMIQTFKIVKGLEDIPTERFFKFCKQSSTRGHSLKLEKPRCRTTTRQQHVSQRVINDWNSLPE